MPTIDQCVDFAAICKRHKLYPKDLAELCRLAKRRANAEVALSHHLAPALCQRAERAQSAVEGKAKEMGLRTEWSGLYPTLFTVNKEEIRLPF